MTLKPKQIIFEDQCTEMKWLKYNERGTTSEIVHHQDDTTLYFKDFCAETLASCKASTKLVLNHASGWLTIYELELSDEDDYYFLCNITNQKSEYEMFRLNINGKTMTSCKLVLVKKFHVQIFPLCIQRSMLKLVLQIVSNVFSYILVQWHQRYKM